jgi:hypothetical protein
MTEATKIVRLSDDKETNIITFKSIEPEGFFEFEESVYVKLQHYDPSDNAIRFPEGSSHYFPNDIQVKPVKRLEFRCYF